jgi:hypothetical protein
MSGPPAHGRDRLSQQAPGVGDPPVTPALASKRARGNDADSEAAGRPSSAASIQGVTGSGLALPIQESGLGRPHASSVCALPRIAATQTRLDYALPTDELQEQEQPLAWVVMEILRIG